MGGSPRGAGTVRNRRLIPSRKRTEIQNENIKETDDFCLDHGTTGIRDNSEVSPPFPYYKPRKSDRKSPVLRSRVSSFPSRRLSSISFLVFCFPPFSVLLSCPSLLSPCVIFPLRHPLHYFSLSYRTLYAQRFRFRTQSVPPAVASASSSGSGVQSFRSAGLHLPTLSGTSMVNRSRLHQSSFLPETLDFSDNFVER